MSEPAFPKMKEVWTRIPYICIIVFNYKYYLGEWCYSRYWLQTSEPNEMKSSITLNTIIIFNQESHELKVVNNETHQMEKANHFDQSLWPTCDNTSLCRTCNNTNQGFKWPCLMPSAGHICYSTSMTDVQCYLLSITKRCHWITIYLRIQNDI